MNPTRFAAAIAVTVSIAVAGCGDGSTQPQPQDSGADVLTLDANVRDTGVPTDAGCQDGLLGCPCDNGSCTTGACVSGMCVDCRIASAGCACRSNGSCDSGLRCNASDVCETCPEGENGCACVSGMTCNSGLECSAGVCVPDSCVDGTLDCPCRASAPRCDGGGICDMNGLCRACSDDMPGCPCRGGACSGGLVCDATSTTCRAPATCADLRAALLCGEFEECVEGTPGTDAMCVSGMCVTGYRWQASTSSCIACVSPDCSAEPSCMAADPGFLDCGADHRVCDIDGDGFASCGDCETGYTDIAGVCVQVGLCGTAVCGAMEYCDTTNPAGPTCTRWPCPRLNQARDTRNQCVTCNRSCQVAGSTGRFWPYTDNGDVCVCETAPGYYFDNGGESEPVLCDEDGDGWVRVEVRAILDRAPPDPAIVANARCDVRSAGTVELRDEYGNASRIDSCDEGLLQDRDMATACTPYPLRLFETKRNDVPGEAERLDQAPPYSAGGRRFRPEELNGLTKACVSPLGDFDDDGEEDITQFQPLVDTSSLGEVDRLRSFAHFVELYRTSWVAPAMPGGLGTLVIQERSRCDTEFPITYGSNAAYEPTVPQTYWRNCERLRRPGFDADSMAPPPGYDFAQWSCDAATGVCDGPGDHPAVPAHVSATARPGPTDPLLRNHGLCELARMDPAARPADMRFRGMHHHSQFQCVEVVADSMTPRAHQRTQSSFGGTSLTTTGPASSPAAATLTFNSCQVLDCTGMAGCTDSEVPTENSGVDAHDPNLECTVAPVGTTPVPGTVGWAAVRYQTYGELDSQGNPAYDQDYNGGCVNEQALWDFLCPARYDVSVDPERSYRFGYCNPGLLDAFGRYCCYGCGEGCPFANAGGNCLPTAADPTVTECRLGDCDPGFGNCDNMESNGCENTTDSLQHCDECNRLCSRANATATCEGDVCRMVSTNPCQMGFGNCDNQDANGCEDPLNGPTHCTSCGRTCPRNDGAQVNVASASCANDQDECRVTGCNTGWYNVDNNHANGCECQETETNNTCQTAINIGQITGSGQELLRTGRIPVASSHPQAADYYIVTFTNTTPATGSASTADLRVDFAQNPGNEFRLAVYTDPGCGTRATCGNGTDASSLDSWSFQYNQAPPGAQRWSGMQSTLYPAILYIRVFRNSSSVNCNQYQLRIRR